MNFLTSQQYDEGGRRFSGVGRTLVMGILNVTPDSFSDGGRFDAFDRAVAHGVLLASQGADIVDIGAESTRPGFVPVSAEEECARLLPVLNALADRISCPISVDTYKASVAEAAILAGARIVNDVWGFQKDPAIADVCAQHKVGVVLMHNRTEIDPSIDIIDDAMRFLDTSLAIAMKAGIPLDRIALDPGVGFGKSLAQNLAVIAHLDRFAAFGCALLIGASRKSLIGKIVPSTTDERLPGTLALHTAAMLNGAGIVRVHDVREAVQAARVIDSLKEI